MEHSNIDPNNLVHRNRLEIVMANTGIGFDSLHANTLAEALIHTEAIPEDILCANSERRVTTLYKSGYIQKVGGGNPNLYQPKNTDRWRMTPKGIEAINRAIKAPYSLVTEVISSTESAGTSADEDFKTSMVEASQKIRQERQRSKNISSLENLL